MTSYKYLKSALVSLLISYIAFGLAALYQIGAPTESSRILYEINTIKTSFANSIQGPKLLIVSGSNSLLGISSRMIAKETGVPTVNAGLNAGLGIDYILYNARTMAKPGDTVIIPLEYELYMSGNEASDVLVDYVFARDTKYFLTHPWLIALLSLKRLILGIHTKFYPSPQLEIGYQSKVFLNKSGDQINNKKNNMTESQFRLLKNIYPIKMTNKLRDNEHSFETIKTFAKWCTQNRINLIATWPNTMWFEDYNTQVYIQFFQNIEKFYSDINVTVLGRYREFMYEKSMFYDSRYHLNDLGVSQRTRQLINLLRPYLVKKVNNQVSLSY